MPDMLYIAYPIAIVRKHNRGICGAPRGVRPPIRLEQFMRRVLQIEAHRADSGVLFGLKKTKALV